jgi:hypothetical protein
MPACYHPANRSESPVRKSIDRVPLTLTAGISKIRNTKAIYRQFLGKSLAVRGDEGNRTPDQGFAVLYSGFSLQKSPSDSRKAIVEMFLN